MGTPVVASACDGILDVVRDGKNGLLVRPGDAGALADGIERLCKDGALREGLGKAAQADYGESYSFDVWAERYFDFYREALR